MESRTRVIIIGAGIAGPILAILLKMKGYDPVVYERAEAVADVGLSLCLQPNGLRVLSLIPGLIEKIIGMQFEKIIHYSILPDEETVLVDTDVISKLPSLTGFGSMGVRRPVFQRTIIEAAESYGIRINWGHDLTDFQQEDGTVRASFANGKTDIGSFIVGCDGLHSKTRLLFWGEEPVSFTGLTQTGGISPTSEVLKERAMRNVYGDGAHMILYPISETQISWAITQREPEARETWRSIDEEQQKQFKAGPWSQWGFGAGELVRSADRVVKFGLYDRPELNTWHKGRFVLVGDAAHPTSPHLGQGANQAIEDIYHLVRILVRHNPSAAPPSEAVLSIVFIEYENLRMLRTSGLVKKARKQGELRVVDGVDACKKRNDDICSAWRDEDAILASYRDMYSQPFVGKSEI